MNQPNFEERSRGWIPENPKTSKRKLKRMYASVAFILSATVIASLFSTAFVVQSMAPSTLILPAYIHTSTSNPPYSTYVELQGVLNYNGKSYSIIDGIYQEIAPEFHVTWNNGSITNTKALNITFSTNAENLVDDDCQVNIALTADNFFLEKTLDGRMVDGKLIVNSNPTIFMVNPGLLVAGTQIHLGGTPDWQLVGDIANSTWKPQTAIEGYSVVAIGARMYHSTATVPKNWLTLNLGYDINTGMLVSAQGVVSDVLLDAVGIKWIMDNDFKLASYSSNLNLEVVKPAQIPGGFVFWILVIAVPVIVIIISVLAYRIKVRRELALAWNGVIKGSESCRIGRS